MANTLKIKRGTAATIPQGQLAEPLFTTDTYDLYIGKGASLGNQRFQKYIASGTSSQFLKGDGSLDSTTYQATSEKGQNNGYASLDAGGKIPAAQLPSSVIEYKGTWNASTNTPTLADGTGDAGDVYIVSVGGTQNLGSGSITFDAGDWVMYNGSVWQKSTGSNAVASVNGQTGIVSIGVNDLDDATITSASNGQLLQYSTGTNKWINWTPTYISAAITSLNGLTAATQTFANDTNVTITSATSTHTIGWSGQLSIARGGTGLSALGTAGQLLRVNSGATALEYWTPTYIVGNGTANILTYYSTSTTIAAATSSANRFFSYEQNSLRLKLNDNSNVLPLILENTLEGYSVGIDFKLGYGGSGTSIGTPISAGRIYVNPEGTWTATASTQDATMTLYTAQNGIMGAGLSILSDKTIKFDGYSTNGFVKTSSANGTITIDTTTYQPLLTNPVTGTGADTRVMLWTGSTTAGGTDAFTYSAPTLTLGLSATSNQNDYRLLIQRHGTLANPGTWTNSSALQIVDYAADGTNTFISTGLVSIEMPRINTSDTYAGNVVAFRIATDDATVTAIKANGTIHLGQNGSSDTGERLQVNGAGKFSASVTTPAGFYIDTNTYLYEGILRLTDLVNKKNILQLQAGSSGHYITSLFLSGGSQQAIYISAKSTSGQNVIFNTDGSTTFSHGISGTSATFSASVLSNSHFRVNSEIGYILRNDANSANLGGLSRRGYWAGGTAADTQIFAETGYAIYLNPGGSSSIGLTLASTGAATFSSSVTAGGTISITGNFPIVLNSIPATTSQQLQYQNNGTNKWQLYLNTSNNSFNIYNSTNTTDRLTILEGGNVGIGTTLPNAKLDVYGGGSDVEIGLTTTAGFAYTQLRFGASGFKAANAYGLGNSITGGGIFLQANATGDIRMGSGTNEAMRITSGGAVQATNNLTANSPSEGNTGEGIIAGRSFKIDASGSGQTSKMYVVTNTVSDTYGSGLQIQFAKITNDLGFGFNLSTVGAYQLYTKNTSSGLWNLGLSQLHTGQVLIGMTTATLSSNGWSFQQNGGGHTSFQVSNNEAFIYNNRTTGTTYEIDFRTNEVERGKISVTDSGTTYGTSSDYRVKEDFKSFNGLDILKNIKVYDFMFKETKERSLGVIAHELQEVLPIAVYGKKDQVREDGTMKIQQVDYSKIVPVLVKAIQEQEIEIQSLKSKLA